MSIQSISIKSDLPIFIDLSIDKSILIDYPGCSSVWGNTVKSNINNLQLVQNFTARIVLGLKKLNILVRVVDL